MTNQNKAVLNLLMIEQMLGEAVEDLRESLRDEASIIEFEGHVYERKATKEEVLKSSVERFITKFDHHIKPLFISNEVEGQ
ncbi:hypothetical protein KFV08_01180 [Macrococcoides canis]|uniref:hypothetical protein n=1 Tax=Macrococcoides canis TaxID=1855823 RepID=UPI00207C17D0|nr:hypothetical protein [Macrococcus canis]MCO4095945.1 hypothetical protein [Macrococcus canis]UTH09426.1 hypothetical protein KFV08_01180 [Macrococcus canis]